MSSPDQILLADWRRRTAELYAAVRASDSPSDAWRLWRRARDELYAGHPQSPIPLEERASFGGLTYFDYDSAARITAEVEPVAPEKVEIVGSAGSRYLFTRFGRVSFELFGNSAPLDLFWLEGYGGGLFLPFKDAGSRRTTYGGGRYLLDTVKGADLGMQEGRLVLDFNFAYQPSCSYGGYWACPLAPRSNRLDFEVAAGEKLPHRDAVPAKPIRLRT
ncbi:MAG: DUF1684 domain-containing protein [Actinomycetota bacterium]